MWRPTSQFHVPYHCGVCSLQEADYGDKAGIVAYTEQNGIRTFANGREVCVTEAAKLKRRQTVWLRDARRCQCTKDCAAHRGRKCNALLALTIKMAQEFSLPVAHIHHKRRRGLGGSTRDDRSEKLVTSCGICHAGEHRL